MVSVISLKRSVESLLDIKEQIEKINSSPWNKQNIRLSSIHHKLDYYEKCIQQLELKERLVLLAHLLAQLKIAMLTGDEEKLALVAAKFLHGDICNLDGVGDDIKKATEHVKRMLLLYGEFPAKPAGHTSLRRTMKEYAEVHGLIKKEFEELVDISSDSG